LLNILWYLHKFVHSGYPWYPFEFVFYGVIYVGEKGGDKSAVGYRHSGMVT